MATKKEKEEKQKLSVEEAFAKIEEKIEALESDDISLEDSFKAMENGRWCSLPGPPQASVCLSR